MLIKRIQNSLMNLLAIITLALLPNLVRAQEATQKVEMADQFRKDGKIYIVVIVITSILIGLIIYLIVLDKRLKKIEKELS